MSSSRIVGLSRRDFLRYCAATAAVLGLSELEIPRIAAALEDAANGKTPIIWLMGQGCKGCADSLLNSDEPTPGQLILDSFSMRFFPLLSASSGDLAVSAINETARAAKNQYVLLVEGTIPLGAQGAYATMGFEQGRPTTVREWVTQLASGARATIAVGTCAAYGGIPVLFGPADGKTVEALLGDLTPAVPGCPPHPDWIVGTLVRLLLYGKDGLAAQLDEDRRPTEFFSELVHDNCPRRSAFDAGVFVSDFNDNVTSPNACLLTKGCKGPLTHADCPSRRWNQRVNWCIGAGAPCAGCTEPAFYAGLSPLSEMLPSIKLPGARPVGVSADVVGKAIGAATAIGIGAHAVTRVATGKIGPRRTTDAPEEEPAPPVEPGRVPAAEESDAERAHELSGLGRRAARSGPKKRGWWRLRRKDKSEAAETDERAKDESDESVERAEDESAQSAERVRDESAVQPEEAEPSGEAKPAAEPETDTASRSDKGGAPSLPTGYFGPRHRGEDASSGPPLSKDDEEESPRSAMPPRAEGDDS